MKVGIEVSVQVTVEFMALKQLQLPVLEKMTKKSSGFDIKYRGEPVILPPKVVVAIETGFALAIPDGFEGQIRSRSSLSKKGIVVANSPGTIDSDYRGQILVLLRNNNGKDYIINDGDRIAQIIFCPVPEAEIRLVEKLPPSRSGKIGGIGSTGI